MRVWNSVVAGVFLLGGIFYVQSHFTVFFAYLIGYLQAGSEENAFVNRQGDAPKRYTLEDGRDLFVQVCSSCHVSGKMGAPRLGIKEDWKGRLDDGFDVLITRVLDGGQEQGMGCILPRGGAEHYTDGQVIATLKYMVQSVAPKGKDYSAW